VVPPSSVGMEAVTVLRGVVAGGGQVVLSSRATLSAVADAEFRANSPACSIASITSKTASRLLPDGNRPANRAATFARHTDVIKQPKQKAGANSLERRGSCTGP
jgi:hypothetical protein